jgi:hypothetical protein
MADGLRIGNVCGITVNAKLSLPPIILSLPGPISLISSVLMRRITSPCNERSCNLLFDQFADRNGNPGLFGVHSNESIVIDSWAVFRAEDRGIDTTIDPDLNHFFDNLTQFLMDLSSEQSVKLQG